MCYSKSFFASHSLRHPCSDISCCPSYGYVIRSRTRSTDRLESSTASEKQSKSDNRTFPTPSPMEANLVIMHSKEIASANAPIHDPAYCLCRYKQSRRATCTDFTTPQPAFSTVQMVSIATQQFRDSGILTRQWHGMFGRADTLEALLGLCVYLMRRTD